MDLSFLAVRVTPCELLWVEWTVDESRCWSLAGSLHEHFGVISTCMSLLAVAVLRHLVSEGCC